ncbi:MAG: hypothetical protein WC001_06745 [Desulfurivibrionaceae bacterium]
MRDYTNKYSGAVVSRQKVSGGRRSGRADREQPSKIIGVVTVVAMLLGVGSSLWFGLALQEGLGRLDKSRQESSRLGIVNVALIAEKDTLLQQGKIEAAAAGLGLFPPSEQQMRRP